MVRDGNVFYFEGSKGKGIEIPKTISYKELLGVVHHILKLDPTNCFLSMKYVFNANIPTSPRQLTDDGDVKFFIGLNCTNVETLTVDGENGPRFQNESLEGYKVHDWNMNETAINEEDYRMNTNPTSDKQVTQIGSFRTGSTQSAEILTMIDTNDDIRKQYGVQISYDKAWRAKELALGSIRGSPKESYNTLPSYCYVLEQKNPVDGTFLKAKYLETLFIAACKDGNNQIYPLAFGIDRHGSIEKTVHKVFPHARHGVCTYHVGQILKTKFKNPAIYKLFHDAAPCLSCFRV
ncbi:hypothetical protein CK203_113968 [Vitis vinifera]|uniref:MULE transposase domain-containing protein n=1 Tax=Vitis vinifera TaxID=29760 RepID=A0A438DMU7_VITVI|nr:hypothetical protein CK203_113968 [Vitis vinifera]